MKKSKSEYRNSNEKSRDLVNTFSEEGVNQGVNHSEKVNTFDISNNNNEIQNNEVWLTVKEAVNLLGISKVAFHKRRKNGQFVIKQTSGNGGKQYLVALSSLPVEAQARYWETEIKDERLKIKDERDSSLRPAASGTPFRMTLSAKALARHDLLTLYEQAFANAGHGQKKEAKETFVTLYNKKTFARLYEILGPVSYATIERWRKRWESGGRTADVLEDNYRSPSAPTVSAEQSAVLIKHLLSPNKPPLKEVIRLAKQEMQLKGMGFSQSDITFYRYLRGWMAKNMPIYTLVRFGNKKLNDELLPFISRDYSKIEVGDILVADGHILNFEIINPFTGKPKRMTLIMFYDMKSGLPTGFEIMPTENTAVIGSALRRSILFLGRMFGYEDKGFIPRAVYIDNGRAFKSKYFMGVEDFNEEGLKGLYKRLGIETIIAKPYHGQSKTIERFFGTLGEFERRLTSYVGRDIASKPARLMRNEKLHVQAYQALTGGRAPELLSVVKVLQEWILEYAQRPHQDGYYKGYAPLEIFEESMKKVKALPDFESRLVDHGRLNYLMMEEKATTIYRNGIRFNNRYYWNEALYGRREAVIFKYDLMFPEKILVYEPTGEFICEATLPERVHPAAALMGTETDKELLRRQLETQARLKKETTQVGEVLLNAGIEEERLKMKDERDSSLATDGEDSSLALRMTDDERDSSLALGMTKEEEKSVIGQLVEAALRPLHQAQGSKEEADEEPIFVWEYERKAWLERQKKKVI